MRHSFAAFLILVVLLPLVLSASQKEVPIPFDVGEVVRYEVNYKPLFLTPAFKAGEVRIQLAQGEENRREEYRVSAWVQSAGLLTRLAGLDVRDYMESTMDARNFASRSFLHQVRTNRKREDILVRVDGKQRLTRVVVTDLSSEPAREVRNETFRDIPPDVVDYLSIFYRLRADRLEVGREFEIPLSDNGRLKQLTVVVVREEVVDTPLGRYPALLLTTRGGLFRGGGDFQAWFSLDKHRVPLKFEADVRFGKVFGHLIELQTPQMIKSLVRTD